MPHPGNDQSAQWAQIRQIKPDWVFLRGWGVMTPVAIKTAAKVGFPVDHIIGGIWSSSEEDVIPAGAVGKGYLAITTYPAGTDFPIHAELKKYILDKGESDLKDPKSFGSVYYNSGIVEAIFLSRGDPHRPGQVRQPADQRRGRRSGVSSISTSTRSGSRSSASPVSMQPLKLSCLDHEGGGVGQDHPMGRQKWNVVSDWVQSDRDAAPAAHLREGRGLCQGEGHHAARVHGFGLIRSTASKREIAMSPVRPRSLR